MRIFLVVVGTFILIFGEKAFAKETARLILEPASDMIRADLYWVETVPNPQAVLVLCPGSNGNGRELVECSEWKKFAEKHDLGLVGLSFASLPETINRGSGYYYAAQGSGEKLLEGVRRIYKWDIPLILYGTSGGAHFTSRFTEWQPARVITWCAYSAGWWDEPKVHITSPPGIVACGELDPRHGASLKYFKQGRALGKPWLWISLSGVRHQTSPALENFIREYFSAILSETATSSVTVDIDLEIKVDADTEKRIPSLTGHLPFMDLLERWKELHTP